MDHRVERDSIGEIKVEATKYWGAQTQRSLQNFVIGDQKMPIEIIRAFGVLKKCAAQTNFQLGILSETKMNLISKACDEIIEGKLDEHFPLVIWQTGSGTQSNMNINEVIANRGHVLNGGKLSDLQKVLHPNDDVNKSQSSNDTFPTAMTIAVYQQMIDFVIPGIQVLKNTLKKKAREFK
ncbi:MAG: lyase family protein, partial [Bacteroidota bacterium]|nr:lyase family protein [Bacteroidota bacterium]